MIKQNHLFDGIVKQLNTMHRRLPHRWTYKLIFLYVFTTLVHITTAQSNKLYLHG